MSIHTPNAPVMAPKAIYRGRQVAAADISKPQATSAESVGGLFSGAGSDKSTSPPIHVCTRCEKEVLCAPIGVQKAGRQYSFCSMRCYGKWQQ
eukprot:Clim_evm31s227 gene=Clim_evmTU31s227